MKNSIVKYSIITVCYNASKELEKTINSVINQNSSLYEYIIIDGASTDDTVNVLKKYSDKIDLFISEPDKGIYDAMNKGIKAAKGEWALFINAGDLLYNENVLESIDHYKIPYNVGVVYGDVELDFGKAGKLIRSHKKHTQKDILDLCHQGVMTRLDILKEMLYDTSFKIMADLNSFKQIQELGYDFLYIPVVFSTFETTQGISANKPFLSLKESCRIQGIKSLSFKYIKKFFRAFYKMVLQCILSEDVYNSLRYKKIASKKITERYE